MSSKLIIGTPPLGPQTCAVLVGRVESGNVVVQTEESWITIEAQDVATVGFAIITCAETSNTVN